MEICERLEKTRVRKLIFPLNLFIVTFCTSFQFVKSRRRENTCNTIFSDICAKFLFLFSLKMARIQ